MISGQHETNFGWSVHRLAPHRAPEGGGAATGWERWGGWHAEGTGFPGEDTAHGESQLFCFFNFIFLLSIVDLQCFRCTAK